MITFTDRAKASIAKDHRRCRQRLHRPSSSRPQVGRHACQYELHLVRQGDTAADDVVTDHGTFKAYVDPQTIL